MLRSCGGFFLVLTLSLLTPRGEETRTRGISIPQISKRESIESELAAPYPREFAEDHFVSSIQESVKRLSTEHRPLLVHTRVENDTLVLLKEGADNITTALHTPLYSSLQAVSHLPVSVVAILAPDVVQAVEKGETASLSPFTLAALNKTLEVLQKVKDLTESDEENVFSQQQKSRQITILDITEQFVGSLLHPGTVKPSLTLLDEFGESLSEHLWENSRDAVCDYLQSLNSTITQLLRSNALTPQDFDQLSVLIKLPLFAEPRSFIVQYYERLLNYKFQVDTSDTERIILSPSTVQSPPYSELSNTSINTLSESTLTHVITRTFYGKSNVYSSIHFFTSEAAEDVICSQDLMLQSCFSSTNQETDKKLPTGFSNRIERGYVSVIIFISTLSIVLAIVVFCILKEGKVMKTEHRKDETLSDVVSINRNAEEDTSSSDEEEENDQEKLTKPESTRFLNQARGRGRWRGKYRVHLKERRAASSTSTRERGSVTYSEVSVHL